MSSPHLLFPSKRVLCPRRVVVTGCGIVTALGNGWEINAQGFRTGQCAIGPVTLFDVSRQRAKVAAEAKAPTSFPESKLSAKRLARADRSTLLLLAAAHEAWNQSGWTPKDSLPVVIGTTSAGMPLGEAYYKSAVDMPPGRKRQPTRALNYQGQYQVIDMLDSLGCSGPINIIANACASGSNAIGHAWEMVRSGKADQALTGGYDGLCQLVYAGFDSLQALSTTQCKPFEANRDGLALGESATVLTLETLDRAQERTANILGEIIGYGACTDTHHLTQPQPEGKAALMSMNEATRVAEIQPADVQYINAHGTGTVMNDGAEAAAINQWAGDHVAQLHVSSTKASVGHTLGAAGAVEAAICLMALNGQWLPPCVTTENVDPVCRFSYVQKPADAALEIAVSNSFGFGGANATLIFRRWK